MADDLSMLLGTPMEPAGSATEKPIGPVEPGVDDAEERMALGTAAMEFREATDPEEMADIFLEMMETARRIRKG